MDLHSKADKILLCVERVEGVSEEKYFFKDDEQLNPPSISLRGLFERIQPSHEMVHAELVFGLRGPLRVP